MSENNTIYVRRVIYLGNSIIIYFNTPMMRLGYHSYLMPNNYAILETDANNSLIDIYPLDLNSIIIEEPVNGFTVKFTVFNNKNPIFNNTKTLSVGYIYLTTVKYVLSQSGNINNFCVKYKLGNPAKRIDISDGSIEVKPNSLIYSYNGENGFYPCINSQDFYINTGISSNPIIYPIDALYDPIGGNKITFLFKPGDLPDSGEMSLNTVPNPKTKDAFGFFILGNRTLIFGEPDTIILQPGELIPYSTTPINKNFIIYMSNENNNRSYGYTDIITTIKGWVVIYADSLTLTKNVSFINLNINKNVTANFGDGYVNFTDVNFAKTVNVEFDSGTLSFKNVDITGSLTAKSGSGTLTLTAVNIAQYGTVHIGNGDLILDNVDITSFSIIKP
ncbi:MAG: hypothetical protein RSA29_02230 [Clostridium sp.]|uniref:hypothetical protein n=1 Tax=Clostridium sp. TaxID=1506 RepID=UPI0030266239